MFGEDEAPSREQDEKCVSAPSGGKPVCADSEHPVSYYRMCICLCVCVCALWREAEEGEEEHNIWYPLLFKVLMMQREEGPRCRRAEHA